MALVRVRVFNGVAIVGATGILLLNLRTGQYGRFDWQAAREQADKVYEAAGIVVSTARPANLQKFGEAEFKRAFELLRKRGSDRRDIESIIGKGEQEPNSSRVNYRTTTGRTLKAEYGEDGSLQQWQWQDEGRPKLPKGDDV